MEKLQNFIDGKYCDPIDDQWLDNYVPSTGERSQQIPASNVKDVERAYKAAKKHFRLGHKPR